VSDVKPDDWLTRWPDNILGGHFCSDPHPSAPGCYCRRQIDHLGDHAAYVHKITRPETWPGLR
jgi:hypothetical protein